MRIRVVVLLDHVRRAKLEAALTAGDKYLHGEETLLVALHDALVRGQLTAAALPFAPVDIVCAVPESEIDWTLQQMGNKPFRGWKETLRIADDVWKRDGIKFKESFRASTGADVNLVLRTLRESGRRGESPQLKGLLAELLAYLDDDPSASGLTILNPYRTR